MKWLARWFAQRWLSPDELRTLADALEGMPVCPGCFAVGDEPCAIGCREHVLTGAGFEHDHWADEDLPF